MRNVCYDKKTIFLTEIRAIFDDNLFFDGVNYWNLKPDDPVDLFQFYCVTDLKENYVWSKMKFMESPS